jgi:hypothetical protein
VALRLRYDVCFPRNTSNKERNAMQKFIAKFGELIQGVISGADRLVFRGSLRAIQYRNGLMGYLWHKQVLLTDFGKHAERVTAHIKKASLEEAKRQQRPVQYLVSSKTDKKTLAEQIAVRDHIDKGLICVLSCVEPCLSFDVGPNPETKRIELKYRLRLVPFSLSLLDASDLRIHERSDSDLVSISSADLPKRAGMAGSTNGRQGIKIHPT